MIPDRSYTKCDLWPRPSDSGVIGSLMHIIHKTQKGADACSVPCRQGIYTNAHTHRKGDTHGALMLALFPFLPPEDKSTIRVSALPCMSLFLSFFLLLEGFFLCGDFGSWQTGMRIYLNDLPLLIHGASISHRDEVFERDGDDTQWDRGEWRKVHPLVLVGSIWLHAKGERERRGWTARVMSRICGQQRTQQMGIGQIRMVDIKSQIPEDFTVRFTCIISVD